MTMTNEMPATKECSKCHKTLEVDNFARNNSRKSGRHSACKACDKAWRDANAEQIRTYGRATTLKQSEVLALFKERKNCAYCGCAIGVGPDVAKITADHVYSQCHDLGGQNSIKNIQAVCLPCNLSKKDAHVFDFYQRSEKFTPELWRAFCADFIGRLIERPITAAEVDTMTERFAAEAAESRSRT